MERVYSLKKLQECPGPENVYFWKEIKDFLTYLELSLLRDIQNNVDKYVIVKDITKTEIEKLAYDIIDIAIEYIHPNYNLHRLRLMEFNNNMLKSLFFYGPIIKTLSFKTQFSGFNIIFENPFFVLKDSTTITIKQKNKTLNIGFIQGKKGKKFSGSNRINLFFEMLKHSFTANGIDPEMLNANKQQLINFIEFFLDINIHPSFVPKKSTFVSDLLLLNRQELFSHLSKQQKRWLLNQNIRKYLNNILKRLGSYLDQIQSIRRKWVTSSLNWDFNILASTDVLDEDILRFISNINRLWQYWLSNNFIKEIPVPKKRIGFLKTHSLPLDTRILPKEKSDYLTELISPQKIDGYVVHGVGTEGVQLLKQKIGKVDFIYADPPWHTGRDFSYQDSFDLKEWEWMFYDTMYKFSQYIKADGNILTHISPQGAKKARPILDSFLVPKGEMIWAYRTGGAPRKTSPLAQKYDTILHYSKIKNPFFNQVKEKIVYEKPFFKDKNMMESFVTLRDIFEDNITVVFKRKEFRFNVKPVINLSKERVPHFHTQKPEALLALLLLIFTNQGDWVADPFGGTGTTALASLKMKRRFFITEASKFHIDIISNRILSAFMQKKPEPLGITKLFDYKGGGIVFLVTPKY